jgi:uncharacterized repeat protein (TIGR03847 family)
MTTDFGVAKAVDAQSFGQPGQRTFRLRIIGESQESASLWLEKEQLQALSLALKQMLAQLEYNDEPPEADAGDFPVVADHDFRVGRLGMGFNAADRTVILYTYEIGAADDDDAEPSIRVRLTQEASASLSAKLDDIVAGGRPVCPLCGSPIEPSGHACVRSNGHSQQPIPDEQSDDES